MRHHSAEFRIEIFPTGSKQLEESNPIQECRYYLMTNTPPPAYATFRWKTLNPETGT